MSGATWFIMSHRLFLHHSSLQRFTQPPKSQQLTRLSCMARKAGHLRITLTIRDIGDYSYLRMSFHVAAR